ARRSSTVGSLSGLTPLFLSRRSCASLDSLLSLEAKCGVSYRATQAGAPPITSVQCRGSALNLSIKVFPSVIRLKLRWSESAAGRDKAHRLLLSLRPGNICDAIHNRGLNRARLR